jgi:antitoxin component YwqK of YwqJK toxin-antitoxin module
VALRILIAALLPLTLTACGGGGESVSPPGEAPAPVPKASEAPGGAGPSFDPVAGVPSLPGAPTGPPRATTVHMDDGDLRFIEQAYPGGNKKSRRQVKRTADGVVNHGPYVRWYKNGVVAEQGEYAEGLKHGVFVERFDTGQMKVETPYVAGRIHGLKREWSDVGFVKKEAHFEDGELHGSYGLYLMRYEGQRQPQIVGQHERGQKTGTWTYHYGTGEKRDLGAFVEGLREGLWTTWFASGELQREVHYRAGEYHGELVEYDQGTRVSSATYDGGTPAGVQILWFPNGKKRSERTFAGGQPSGPATTWYESGQVESRGALEAGKKQGAWEFWRRDGSLDAVRSGTYEQGARVES